MLIGLFSVPRRRCSSSGIGGFQVFSWMSNEITRGTAPDWSRIRLMMALSTSASSGETTRSLSWSVLRRGDMQQRDQLAGGRDGVLDQAVMRELCQLLNADAGVTENLDHRP